jgi:hypothetical protein
MAEMLKMVKQAAKKFFSAAESKLCICLFVHVYVDEYSYILIYIYVYIHVLICVRIYAFEYDYLYMYIYMMTEMLKMVKQAAKKFFSAAESKSLL